MGPPRSYPAVGSCREGVPTPTRQSYFYGLNSTAAWRELSNLRKGGAAPPRPPKKRTSRSQAAGDLRQLRRPREDPHHVADHRGDRQPGPRPRGVNDLCAIAHISDHRQPPPPWGEPFQPRRRSPPAHRPRPKNSHPGRRPPRWMIARAIKRPARPAALRLPAASPTPRRNSPR